MSEDKTIDYARYERQILLQEIGKEGQDKLRRSSVIVIGAGGLGSGVLLYLAASGVGKIGIVDGDSVDISNLQRQVIHKNDSIGINKAVSAKSTLCELNPDINIKGFSVFAKEDNISDLIKDYDFVVDATDNFEAKFLINKACVQNNKPFSHAGILELEGQVMTVIPHQTACYNCIFIKKPKDPQSKAVLGVVPAFASTIQASEAIKYLAGFGTLLTNSIFSFNLKENSFRTINISKNKNCPVCG